MGRRRSDVVDVVATNLDENESKLELLLKDNKYKKSNFLIGAKYESTLLENQLLAISLAHADEFYKDEKGVLVSKLKATEIRAILGKKGGSFYNTLSKTANLMTTRNIGVIDPEKQMFDYVTLVMRARYENGELFIFYNPYLENYLTQVKKNYTEFNIRIMVSFKSEHSFRLYELIKSQCYYRNKYRDYENTYLISFGLSELMFELGIIDADKDDIRKILKNNSSPDFDKAAEKAKDKKVIATVWAEFRRRVLDVAVKEINDNPDINMDIKYDTVAKGRGGKITRVIFTVTVGSELLSDDQIAVDEKVLTDEEKEDILDRLEDIIEEKVKHKDLKAIAEAAGYNVELIREKYNISKHSKVDNLVGWLIAAIKNDYSEPVGASPKTTKKAKGNWDIAESRVDYIDLEDMLLDN